MGRNPHIWWWRPVHKSGSPFLCAIVCLPVILGINTRRTYFQTASLFFKRAEEMTNEGLLAELMDPDIVINTFEEYYTDAAPGTVNKLLAAIEKVHLGCIRLGWTKASCPITPEFREWVKSFRDDSDVRSPRLGYRPEDAEKVVAYLKEKRSVYALPANGPGSHQGAGNRDQRGSPPASEFRPK